MGRALRIDEPGLIHHVHGMASDHRVGFRDAHDQRVFARLVSLACERFGLSVLAYCVMTTHYHAVVQSHEGRLSEAMQWILSIYVRQFNARHGSNGALFRGRFNSVAIESLDQLAATVRYVHANALDLPGVDRAERHPFSTCRLHATTRPAPRWLLRSAVAYALRHDRRLSNTGTKTHVSSRERRTPALVPEAAVAQAIEHYGSAGFEVRPHPAQPRNKSPVPLPAGSRRTP